MARQKSDKELDKQKKAQPEEVVETSEKAVETPEKEVEAAEEVVEQPKEMAELPEIVRNTLRLNPQYKKAYVTENGLLFVEGTPQSYLGDAVLYDNPYYKQ